MLYRLVKNFWQNVRYVWPDNIKRLISFFPSICSDWDFDAVPGIYRYLRVKLKRLEPCLRHGHLVGGVKYANQVRDVITALDRLIEDAYEDKELEASDKKWGKPAFDFVPLDNGHFRMVDKREEKMSPGELEEMKKERKEAYKEAERKRVEDINFVFETIRKNHRNWWD